MVLLLHFLIFIAFSITTFGQLIVNVENSRIQSDTTGWNGSVGTSFSYSKNVQQILNINATAHVQYKTEKDLYLLLANYNRLTNFNQQLLNNVFYHLRYNRKLGKVVRWEAFTQWQQNRISNIDLRALFGTGPRFKVHEDKKFRIYSAALAMYEYEVDRDPRVVLHDIRSDNYVSFTFKPNPVFDVTSTTFYQPLFKQFSDFRILNQIVFNIKATRHFSISTNWDYSYDSFPALGTPNVNFTITNGFSYTF
ncbi:DUF481 domain-containing protein [Segetibacter sp.]|jgi:hypothetical protein|uniref:DUF481 domain-containing protein n=1 Tax=Segetibacter sp. TaxID=2231182 RepID=UPI00262EADE7|nr:DUF481 domain-containing protein [Segetibacter sp.]MCW3079267.1 hypothetical protein [Segetibacter sp.]